MPEVRASDLLGVAEVAAIGKPIPPHRREAAQALARKMGLTNTSRAWQLIHGMANYLEQNCAHLTMMKAKQTFELPACYALMACLLNAPDPAARKKPNPPKAPGPTEKMDFMLVYQDFD